MGNGEKKMETFLPDAATRADWANEARLSGEKSAFWRSLPELPARPSNGHKGTFGTAVAVGGSRGMSGAIALTGAAALVSGAGLTRLVVPDPILETVAGFEREYTTIPVASDALGRLAFGAKDEILRQANGATAVAVGPGLGRSADLDALVAALFFELERPSVFDADALNALAAAGVFASNGPFAGREVRGARILTPHPGEFARLTGAKPPTDEAGRVDAARTFAERIGTLFDETNGKTKRTEISENQDVKSEKAARFVVVLKGAGTVVADETGRVAVNETGNSNLATGGSGDVLTGIVLGLTAQGAAPFDAARLGGALHGLAANLRSKIVSRGAVASDVVRFLPVAFDYLQTAAKK